MSRRDLEEFAQRHQLTQESVLELATLFDKAASASRSGAYTVMDDPDLRDYLSEPVELQLDEESALSTTGTLDSYGYDDESTTREYPLIQPLSSENEGRYQDMGLIGYGGMGEVRRIRDRDLNRVMAMKIIRPKLLKKPLAISRFVEEAQATAQLQHPGVVPVHEMGRLSDGRIYFTMQEIRGMTYGSVIHKLHDCSTYQDWGVTPDGWTLRKIMEAFRQVCETIGFAHKRGVIHRDLKPENIMVGKYGEVLVVDWGLAKVISISSPPESTDEVNPLETHRSSGDAFATMQGAIAGTPAYMPPEQARGEVSQIGPHSDVYALGAILYEILSGRPPYVGNAKGVINQILQGPPEPLTSTSNSALDTLGFESDLDDDFDQLDKIPPELAAVCERAMHRNPHQRYASAQELYDAIESWLSGQMRQERGLSLVQRGNDVLTISESYASKAMTLQLRAEKESANIHSWDTEATKASIWAIEDEAKQLQHRSEVKRLEAEQMYQAALTYDSGLVEAHRALADLYLEDHQEYESQGNERSSTRAFELLRLHVRSLPEEQRKAYIGYLHGSGSVTILTEPPGAEVHIYMYEEVDRRLKGDYIGQFDTTPLAEFPIGMGSYKLVLKAPGREDVHYPVAIRRQEHWNCVPPGKTEPEPIYLPQEGSLGPDDISHTSWLGCHWWGTRKPGQL